MNKSFLKTALCFKTKSSCFSFYPLLLFHISKIERSIPYFCKTKRREKKILLGNVLKFLRNPDFSAENSGKIQIEWEINLKKTLFYGA